MIQTLTEALVHHIFKFISNEELIEMSKISGLSIPIEKFLLQEESPESHQMDFHLWIKEIINQAENEFRIEHTKNLFIGINMKKILRRSDLAKEIKLQLIDLALHKFQLREYPKDLLKEMEDLVTFSLNETSLTPYAIAFFLSSFMINKNPLIKKEIFKNLNPSSYHEPRCISDGTAKKIFKNLSQIFPSLNNWDEQQLILYFFLEHLSSYCYQKKTFAILALTQIFPDIANPEIQALIINHCISALSDKNAAVIITAIESFGRIDPNLLSPKVLITLLSSLLDVSSNDQKVPPAASKMVGHIFMAIRDPDMHKKALSILIEKLQDKSTRIRFNAIKSLRPILFFIENPAIQEKIILNIKHKLSDDNFDVRIAAIRVLIKATEEISDKNIYQFLLMSLTEGLWNTSLQVRELAMTKLTELHFTFKETETEQAMVEGIIHSLSENNVNSLSENLKNMAMQILCLLFSGITNPQIQDLILEKLLQPLTIFKDQTKLMIIQTLKQIFLSTNDISIQKSILQKIISFLSDKDLQIKTIALNELKYSLFITHHSEIQKSAFIDWISQINRWFPYSIEIKTFSQIFSSFEDLATQNKVLDHIMNNMNSYQNFSAVPVKILNHLFSGVRDFRKRELIVMFWIEKLSSPYFDNKMTSITALKTAFRQITNREIQKNVLLALQAKQLDPDKHLQNAAIEALFLIQPHLPLEYQQPRNPAIAFAFEFHAAQAEPEAFQLNEKQAVNKALTRRNH